MTYNINNRIRLSHSSLDLFNSCERKFQLDRLLAGSREKEESEHLVFGKAFGAGVASYFLDQDSTQAIFKAWLEYYPVIENKSKTWDSCLGALLNIFPTIDNLLQDWEVATFNDKPAIELSFNLNISERFYFVGYIDLVLKNIFTGKAAILEVKTTSIGLLDLDALYRNSGQALGYSIALDKITGEEHSEYDVIYLVSQINTKTDFSYKPHILRYSKSLYDRLDWFITLGMDVNRLESSLDLNMFPRRGATCLSYMRPCIHLGTCNLHGLDVYKEIPSDLVEYDFYYNLEDLIQDHIQRTGD